MEYETAAYRTVTYIVDIPEGTGDAAGSIAGKTFAGTSSAAVCVEGVADGAGEADSAIGTRLTSLNDAVTRRTGGIGRD